MLVSDDVCAGLKLPEVKGDIRFRNVDFAYPTRPEQPVLRKLQLDIAAGTKCAFVGPR
jgi:ABC-type multidrug transport system fused ATPase/permease subunit